MGQRSASTPAVRGLLGLLAVVAVATAALPAAASGGRSQEAHERREQILAYWTPERVRSAIPRALRVGDVPAHHRPDHAGGPGGGDGGDTDPGGTDGAVTGAPWSDASQPGMVGETTGKVLFTLKGSDYVCSGSTVTSSGSASLVLTAGHCVHDGDNRSTSWASNWMFVPAYEDGGTFSSCADTTYGCWTAGNLTTTSGWYASGDFSDDTGFAVMDPGGKAVDSSLELADTVGTQGIRFDHGVVGFRTYAFGYPAAKWYKGRDLVYCAGTAVDGVAKGTAGLACDMTGGSSGGPWYADFSESTATGTAVSVNSHIYLTIKDTMFGPLFDGDERAAYDLASGATSAGARSRG